MVYDCHDLTIILRNTNSNSDRVPIPSIMNEKKFSNRCLFLKAKGKTKSNYKFYSSGNVHYVYMTLLAVYILRARNNQNLFIAIRYSSNSCIKEKIVATCPDVSRLLLMCENLTLMFAKKRCEWECNKTIISENCCVFSIF